MQDSMRDSMHGLIIKLMHGLMHGMTQAMHDSMQNAMMSPRGATRPAPASRGPHPALPQQLARRWLGPAGPPPPRQQAAGSGGPAACGVEGIRGGNRLQATESTGPRLQEGRERGLNTCSLPAANAPQFLFLKKSSPEGEHGSSAALDWRASSFRSCMALPSRFNFASCAAARAAPTSN